MGKKGKQRIREQIVDCEVCDGVIFLGIYMGSDDVVYCEDCGTEYLIDSREPLHIELLEEDEDDDDDYNIMIGYGDDDYDDGRYE